MSKRTFRECDFCEREEGQGGPVYGEMTDWVHTDGYDMCFCYTCQNIVDLILDKEIVKPPQTKENPQDEL